MCDYKSRCKNKDKTCGNCERNWDNDIWEDNFEEKEEQTVPLNKRRKLSGVVNIDQRFKRFSPPISLNNLDIKKWANDTPVSTKVTENGK